MRKTHNIERKVVKNVTGKTEDWPDLAYLNKTALEGDVSVEEGQGEVFQGVRVVFVGGMDYSFGSEVAKDIEGKECVFEVLFLDSLLFTVFWVPLFTFLKDI